jgi:hypothetical protein
MYIIIIRKINIFSILLQIFIITKTRINNKNDYNLFDIIILKLYYLSFTSYIK